MTGEDPTLLLERWRGGDPSASDQLMQLLNEEMRAIASRLMRRESSGHTLQPTAVVNEACLRLLGANGGLAADRRGFLYLATRVMRQVLVDHSRRKRASKRGGQWGRVSIEVLQASDDSTEELLDALDLDLALERLARVSPRQAQIAELRSFGGLSIAETADVLGIGVTTVKSEWTVAILWLRRALDGRHGERTGT